MALKAGLEIHQQLNSGKLFCNCDINDNGKNLLLEVNIFGINKNLYDKKIQIEFKDFIIDDIPELSSYGMYRPLFQKYNDIELDYDSDDPVFSFWLHKGTYATSFLREIMKSSDVTVY